MKNEIKATVKIAKVYNTLLEEESTQLIVEKDGKVYEGALFFELDPYDEITEILEQREVTGAEWGIIYEAYKLMEKHGLTKKSTLKTMLHWQWINGLTEKCFDGAYKFENDAELLKAWC